MTLKFILYRKYLAVCDLCISCFRWILHTKSEAQSHCPAVGLPHDFWDLGGSLQRSRLQPQVGVQHIYPSLGQFKGLQLPSGGLLPFEESPVCLSSCPFTVSNDLQDLLAASKITPLVLGRSPVCPSTCQSIYLMICSTNDLAFNLR